MSGFQRTAGVHRDPGSAARDDGGLLAHGVGAWSPGHRHAHTVQGGKQGNHALSSYTTQILCWCWNEKDTLFS